MFTKEELNLLKDAEILRKKGFGKGKLLIFFKFLTF